MRGFKNILIALLLASLATFSEGSFAQANSSKPKNIIILFADGAAGTQFEFGRYSNEQLRNQPFAVTDVVMGKGQLQLMRTESANAFVTDSAAAASAMSTGYKVNNGAISTTPDGSRPATLMEVAKANGKRIGLISTAPIYDASPAAFSVHAKNRRDSELIVNQYIDLAPEVLMGGGQDYFLPKINGGKRQDGQNIVEVFKGKGYQYVNTPDQLEAIRAAKILGLFAAEDIDYEIDRDSKAMPNLSQMVSAGLKALSKNAKQKSDAGFILFAENENTDSAGHQNDVAALMRDLWVFDDAVKVALEFQKKHPDTLIIVTGDHETGGFAPTYGRKNLGPAGPSNYLNVSLPQLKQIEAFTMSLNEFSERMKAKAKEGASEKDLDRYLSELLKENYPGLELEEELRQKIITQSQLSPNYNYLPSNLLAQAIARQTGFYWGTSGHTSEPIIVAAIGPGAQIFKGYGDNTDFARKLKQLIQGK